MEDNNVVETEKDLGTKKRSRKSMPFATMPARECTIIPESIWKYAAGQNIRRLTLFDQIGKSPESGPSRTLITACSKYGFTKGGAQAEYIELTSDGFVAFNPEEKNENKIMAKFRMIIQNNDYFNGLYEKYKNLKLPVKSVLIDSLRELGLDISYCEDAAELFIENARYVGIIKVLSGAERIIAIDQVIEEINGQTCVENEMDESTSSISATDIHKDKKYVFLLHRLEKMAQRKELIQICFWKVLLLRQLKSSVTK